jgi:propanol-preferring alcohol dehydrogenase
MIGKDLDGGFAEYVAVPALSAVRLPRSVPFEQGAILGCAVSTAYHALRRARLQPKDTLVVIGVGGLGMHAVQLAKKIFHARRVIALDRFDWKINQAKGFGADHTVNAATQDAARTIARLTEGTLADVVVNFVGSAESNQLGLACVGKGGRLVLVGISEAPLTISPYRTIIGGELEIIGVDDHVKTELSQLVNYAKSGRIDLSRSVTHTVPLEAVNDGFRILEDKNERPIRVVVLNGN